MEKEATKSYDIRALWQRNRDLGMIFPSSQVGLGQPPELQPNNGVSSLSSLSNIIRDSASLLSNQKTLKIQQTEALKDLNKLLKLVTGQDKKYNTRLSPHSNFYC